MSSKKRLVGLGGAATLLVAASIALLNPDALAATLFSADFESGSTSDWSKSGGTWSVVTDGSKAFDQSDSGTDRARQFAGSTSWTNYSVQARVKATSFANSGSVVALAARASGATQMYRLALTSGAVRLQYMNGSSVTDLATLSRTVSTGTWYTLKLSVSGSTISGSIDGTSVGSATSTAVTAGRIGLFTGYASGRFDDVSVTDSGTTTPSSTPPSTPPTSGGPTGTPPPTTGPVGWATQGGGTTGGAGGGTVTVTSYADLVTQAKSAATQTIRVSGLFSCSEDVRVAANKTILGVGSGSGLVGCGINIRDVSNVIVRNMNISKVLAGNGNGDAIHIDGATRLWIDHNDLSSDTSHGTDYYDGLLDITHGADYITASWNRIHDHIKCSLVGHSDSNASEDTGHLRVTYHHNLFSNCAERNPRVRFANPVHVFNNYYVQTQSFDYSYGIATTMGAGVLVEGNSFENIPEPTHLHEGDSDPGNLVARNNTTVNSGPILTSGSVASIPYSYSLESSATVKSSVTAGAGTGKI
ncbi:pectate lyase [Dactylosporangium salmoneum]|uniref:Pectate lyase domain-containing protein n=1 Tax=Dactylosporangium salmoneum TaxID=53361 RepID=A0ABN3GZJ8_9ACTN